MRILRITPKIALFGFLAFLLAVAISVTSETANSSKADEAVKTNINAKMPASKHISSIVLGAGCFWGAEKRYEEIPGVIDAISGYADGVGVKANYKEITKRKHRNNPNNHAEVVKVIFNTAQVDLETILRTYFEAHDPTQLNRQGNDIGTQYRSTILYNNKAQSRIIYTVRNQYQQALSKHGYGKIVTKIKPLKTFYSAESYHQDYLKKNPYGYCPDHSTGVTFADKPKQPVVDNSALVKGQQIVVIDSPACAFCEKFKKKVVSKYHKKTPISFRRASQLKGLKIKTATWATPTILFMKNGKELFGHQGYMSPDKFYAVHDKLKFK